MTWGTFAALSLAFPGPSGEWASLGVLACWVVNVPIGLLTLVVALTVKQGSPRLRRLSMVIGLVALSLPIITSLIWHLWR